MRINATVGILVCATLAAAPARADPVADGDAAFHRGDYQQALALLQGPADRGDAGAELDIGLLYFAGNGVPQDRHEAARWFLAAARQGQVGALADAGIVYVTGSGVPRNLVQAYMWFSLGAEAASGATAKYLDRVAGEMTPNEIAHAKTLVVHCKASGYKACESVQCLTGPLTRTFGGSSWQLFACDDGRSLAFVAAPGSPAAPYDFTLSYYDARSAISSGSQGNAAATAAREEVRALSEPQRAALFSAASAATPIR